MNNELVSVFYTSLHSISAFNSSVEWVVVQIPRTQWQALSTPDRNSLPTWQTRELAATPCKLNSEIVTQYCTFFWDVSEYSISCDKSFWLLSIFVMKLKSPFSLHQQTSNQSTSLCTLQLVINFQIIETALCFGAFGKVGNFDICKSGKYLMSWVNARVVFYLHVSYPEMNGSGRTGRAPS